MQQQQQQAAAAGQQQGYPPAAAADPPSTPPQQFLQTALVDPSGECEHCTCGAGQSCWWGPPSVSYHLPAHISAGAQPAPLLVHPAAVNDLLPNCSFTSTPLPPWADPTRVYLTQPLDSSQQRQDAPKFPAPLV